MKQKDIKNFINNMKEYSPTAKEILEVDNIADRYKDKSEEDIFVEIIKVNSEMEEQMSEEQYAEIFEKLESVRPILSEEQNAKLDKILELLNKNK